MRTFRRLSSLIVDVNAIEGLAVEQRRRKSTIDGTFLMFDYVVFVTTKHHRYRLESEIFSTREEALARRDSLFEQVGLSSSPQPT